MLLSSATPIAISLSLVISASSVFADPVLVPNVIGEPSVRFPAEERTQTNLDLIRDAELMEALRIIEIQNRLWTAEDWHNFGWKAAKYISIGSVVGGALGALYYYKMPRGFSLKPIMISKESLAKAQQFVATHGGKVALTVAGPIIVTNLVTQLMSMANVSESDRLRNAATPDARVYRSHLRQFFKLSLSEQFLIARQDEVLMDDVLRLARWIQAKRAQGTTPR